ncbi:MAG: DUF4166 domain-containing protein [Steroidobacteraceae bacterium]|jgi:hypothetical protein|nr:DUF4166 domain-containing protein [Steroidobacteraceae bacterium]
MRIMPIRDGTTGSLHSRLLDGLWAQLPAAVRDVHRRRPMRLLGHATVLRGSGWMSRLGGYVSGLPTPGHDLVLRVTLEASSHAVAGKPTERWERRFGGSAPMISHLHVEGDRLVEVVGVVHLAFRLVAMPSGLRWDACGGRLWGWLPMPRAWLAGITASESAVDGSYAFGVRVDLPLVGLVVDYRGSLWPDDPAMVSP